MRYHHLVAIVSLFFIALSAPAAEESVKTSAAAQKSQDARIPATFMQVRLRGKDIHAPHYYRWHSGSGKMRYWAHAKPQPAVDTPLSNADGRTLAETVQAGAMALLHKYSQQAGDDEDQALSPLGDLRVRIGYGVGGSSYSISHVSAIPPDWHNWQLGDQVAMQPVLDITTRQNQAPAGLYALQPPAEEEQAPADKNQSLYTGWHVTVDKVHYNEEGEGTGWVIAHDIHLLNGRLTVTQYDHNAQEVSKSTSTNGVDLQPLRQELEGLAVRQIRGEFVREPVAEQVYRPRLHFGWRLPNGFSYTGMLLIEDIDTMPPEMQRFIWHSLELVGIAQATPRPPDN